MKIDLFLFLSISQMWRTIEEYPNYEVSSEGEVRNVRTGKVMKPVITSGYPRVNVGRENPRTIHRLVALTFIPNPDNKPEVDHIDRNRLNNKLENLRWVTHSENELNKGYHSRKKDSTHHISMDHNSFRVEFYKLKKRIRKCFKTLEEAVSFRDQFMVDNPR